VPYDSASASRIRGDKGLAIALVEHSKNSIIPIRAAIGSAAAVSTGRVIPVKWGICAQEKTIADN
jgi:hypothetical protein